MITFTTFKSQLDHVVLFLIPWRHDIQHNDTQHKDTQHKDTQRKDTQCNN